MGNTTRKKVRSGPQPVNGGRFLNFMGQSLHKAQEHENGKSCTETQIHHRNGVRGIQLQLIGGESQGEHHHLEGNNHGEQAQVIECPGKQAVHPGQCTRRSWSRTAESEQRKPRK